MVSFRVCSKAAPCSRLGRIHNVFLRGCVLLVSVQCVLEVKVFRGDVLRITLLSRTFFSLEVRTWLFKIDDERGSRGTAYIDLYKLHQALGEDLEDWSLPSDPGRSSRASTLRHRHF